MRNWQVWLMAFACLACGMVWGYFLKPTTKTVQREWGKHPSVNDILDALNDSLFVVHNYEVKNVKLLSRISVSRDAEWEIRSGQRIFITGYQELSNKIVKTDTVRYTDTLLLSSNSLWAYPVSSVDSPTYKTRAEADSALCVALRMRADSICGPK